MYIVHGCRNKGGGRGTVAPPPQYFTNEKIEGSKTTKDISVNSKKANNRLIVKLILEIKDILIHKIVLCIVLQCNSPSPPPQSSTQFLRPCCLMTQ